MFTVEPKAPPIANLGGRIDALLACRLRQLRLPPDIRALYTQTRQKSSRRVTAAWCSMVGFANAPLMLLDLGIVPRHALVFVLTCRVAITLAFLAGAVLLRRGRLVGREYLAVMGCCLLTVVLAGTAGLMTGRFDLVLGYSINAIVIVFTAIMILPLELRRLAWLAGLALLAMAGFIALCGVSLPEKLQILVFYGTVAVTLVHARKIQNLYDDRLFLLTIREEVRSADAATRNAQLSSLAYTDKLTDIPNRRYFDEICATMSDNTKHLLPVSLCFIDIDHFKNLNDELGHLRGDRCLRVVAAAIRGHLRDKTDILARYGGEEFVLLLPATGQGAALEVAERIRFAVLELNHGNPGTRLGQVSVSIGVATATAAPLQVEALIAAADVALYRAKSAGRNRVCT